MVGDGRRKVAVVTGGTAGVGRAAVRELSQQGYEVAILARGTAGLEAAAADVRKTGRQALPVPVDVADHEAVRQAAAMVEKELGEITVWVNVAFAGSLAFAWDTSMPEFRRMTEVTYYGQVHGTLAALELMRPRNRGVIINVGSAMAYRSIPLQAPYCGAKHAVKGFTESVMCELAHEKSKVKLCMVQLPGLNTPQFNWNLNKMSKHPMPVPPGLPARAARQGDRVPGRASAPQHVGGRVDGVHNPGRAARPQADRPVPGPDRRQIPADQTRICPGWVLTSSSPETDRRTRALTGPSTRRRMPATRSCGCLFTAAPSWPGSAPPRWRRRAAPSQPCAARAPEPLA